MVINRLVTIFLVGLMCLSQLSCTSFSDENDEFAQEMSALEEGLDERLDNPDYAAGPEEGLDDVDQDWDQGFEQDMAQSEAQPPVDEFASEFPDQQFEDEAFQEEFPPMDTADVPEPIIEGEQQMEEDYQADIPPMDDPFAQSDSPAYEDELSAADEFVRVTGLDYRANESGGTIVIQTSGPARFETQENPANNQYIIELDNAELPSQFQRPYNTKEFSGPVGMINAYQRPGTNKVRIIVQLKEATPVSTVQEGNSLVVIPGAAVAATPLPDVPRDAEEQVAYETAEVGPAVDKPIALNSKTLDEFLMGDTKYYGKKISIEILDGELRDVINFISEESGVNLVLSDEIKGKISVKLRQIPWDQALVVIMQTKQLGYIRQGNILRISTLASIRTETDSARQLLESQKLLEPLRVKVFPVSYAKAKDLEGQAKGFLSTRGSATADERTNNLVVKDIAENVTKIEKLLQRLDTQTPQVYIEGKIVESKTAATRAIGINWAEESAGTVGMDIATGNIVHTGYLSLSAKLNMLESDEKVKILSSPRIMTLNNQPAIIEQATQFPTYVETKDQTTGAVTRTVEYKTVKLSLNVTPQITAEGGVILQTEILREFAGAIDQIAPETGARSLNSRSAKSTVLVENGQTAVLGGIYSTDNTEGNRGLPLLRKIPLIGWLFGQDKMTFDKNELLIFLTPRVINKDKAFNLLSEGDAEIENL